MYDPRAKGKTKHIGTFTAPPQPNPQYRTRTLAKRAAEDAKARGRETARPAAERRGSRGDDRILCKALDDDYPRPQETTNRHNEERVRILVKDFGDRPLRGGISPQEARAWIFGGIVPEEIREAARHWDGAITRPGGDVEVKSRKGHHLAVRAMFNDAVRTQLADNNPFASLNVPEAEGRRGSAITVLTEAELAVLIETARDVLGDYGVHFAALIETLAWTGMRPGEAWALEIEPKPATNNWIDWDAGELHIRWQIDRFGKRRHPKWDRRARAAWSSCCRRRCPRCNAPSRTAPTATSSTPPAACR
jgi:integrase